MVKLYCDNCQEEIKNFDFSFEAMVRSISKLSRLVGGNVQEQPKLEEKRIHLCRSCYDKKFK